MAVYAVCPHCGKNIALQSDYFESGSCPLCEGAITGELLRIKNAFINAEEANIEFETGKQYFDNTDYRGAIEHFKKSLENNANHYLSFYYAGLCEIYENEKNPEYDRPFQLMRVLKYSLLKLDSAQVDMQYRIPFARSALNDVNIMLLAEFNRLSEQMIENPTSRAPRHQLIMLARYVSSFITINKDILLLFDPNIAAAVLAIVDLAISACVKSCTSRVVSELLVSVPLKEEFTAANKIFSSLAYFATTLDPKYSIEQHRPDFSENVVYNKETKNHIEKYYETLGKKNRANFLSAPGEILTQLTQHCVSAASFTYHTLYQNVYVKKNDPLRVDLLVQGAAFCCEALLPRAFVDGYKRVSFNCKSRAKQREFTTFLSVFLSELSDTAPKEAADILNQFYERVHEVTGKYFDEVTKKYSKFVNKIKAQQGKEFQYYLDFLVNIVHASALALTETVACTLGKKKKRVDLLKIGKAAAEEFLLLNDYRVVELEKTPLYADLLQIWNLYEQDIVVNLR